MHKILTGIVIICLAFSCANDSKIEEEISKIDIEIKVERFDKLFARVTPEGLPELKADYPFMFSKIYSDSVWINRINDTLQQQLNLEVEKLFEDSSLFENDVHSLFQHLKYYYKEFKTPRVITVTSDVDYRNKTIVTDSIVLIALDTYLGTDHEFYQGLPLFLTKNFKAAQIVVDLASNYAEKQIYQAKRKSFLEEMVYYGKILYFEDVMIPFKKDEEKIGYTSSELDWAIANESNIWGFFVENELLFDSDPKLLERFINPAPFSKFYLEFDSESPGRLGQYMGWQIVKAYMINNNVSIQKMLAMNAQDIFNNAKFKPRR